MNAVDTNILIYRWDRRDTRKQGIALELIENLEDGCLLWQVVCEYLANAKKLEHHGFDIEEVYRDVEGLSKTWYLHIPSFRIFEKAVALAKQFSFWDALLISACLESNIEVLYSEDLGDRQIEELRIINPFA